jgi:multiple sugar transport system ATP-binding protein
MIYVTHDQIEALTLADRIAVMRNGSHPATRRAAHDLQSSASTFIVAGFMGSPGMNFIKGQIDDNGAFAVGEMRIPLDQYPFTTTDRPQQAIFGIRPEHVVCGAAAESEPFSAEADIEVVEPMGADTLVWALLEGREFRFRVDGQSELRAGEVTRIGFDPAKASIFDANTELRL